MMTKERYLTSSSVHSIRFTDNIQQGDNAGITYGQTIANWHSNTVPFKVEDTCNTVRCNPWPLVTSMFFNN